MLASKHLIREPCFICQQPWTSTSGTERDSHYFKECEHCGFILNIYKEANMTSRSATAVYKFKGRQYLLGRSPRNLEQDEIDRKELEKQIIVYKENVDREYAAFPTLIKELITEVKIKALNDYSGNSYSWIREVLKNPKFHPIIIDYELSWSSNPTELRNDALNDFCKLFKSHM